MKTLNSSTPHTSSPESKEILLHVKGMHCAACELLIEKKLATLPGVQKVEAKLGRAEVKISTTRDIPLAELNQPLLSHGYQLSTEKTGKEKTDWKNLGLPLLIASAFFILFIALQKLGIVNLFNPKEVTLPFVFVIGVIASLSTCMAVVGGLVLSISSGYAKGHHVKPLIVFHASRLLFFFVLGGLIGLLGFAFILTPWTAFIINSVLFLVMLIMGLNLLDIFSFSKNFQIKLPKSLGHKITALKTGNNFLTPLLLGAATFFLPCGFTQSMQILALSYGNFWQGALTMLTFALGTLPVLALISFISVQNSPGKNSKMFFRSVGFLIIFFALLNILAAFSAVGLLPPVLNF
jgi:sulfite exporter TauE/SafE/copper chaperone CopZ